MFLLALNSTLGERINQARGFNSKQNYKKSNNDFLILIRKIYCYAPLAFKLLIQSAQSAEINHSRRGEGNNHQAGSNKMLSYIPGTGIGLTVSKKKLKFMSLSLHKLVNSFPASPHAPSTWGREGVRAGCRPGKLQAGGDSRHPGCLNPSAWHCRARDLSFFIPLKPAPSSRRLSAAPTGCAVGQDGSWRPAAAGGRSQRTQC